VELSSTGIVLGIGQLASKLYRVMDSKAPVHGTNELVRDFIIREGKLPYLKPPPRYVLRKKLRIHWCSYECYDSPAATSAALQILPHWNTDCKLRATLSTEGLEGFAFVAFNGDSTYSDNTPGGFAGYFVEMRVQDHPVLPGGGLQDWPCRFSDRFDFGGMDRGRKSMAHKSGNSY
jgi:hypothetical protein